MDRNHNGRIDPQQPASVTIVNARFATIAAQRDAALHDAIMKAGRIAELEELVANLQELLIKRTRAPQPPADPSQSHMDSIMAPAPPDG